MENGGEWIAQKRTNSECPPQSHGMAPHFFMGRFFCERKNEHRLIGQTKFALDDAVKLGFLFGRGEQRADLFLITRLEKSAPEQAGQKQICGFMRVARDFELLKRAARDRKSTRLNSSHAHISYAVFFLKKKKTQKPPIKDKRHSTDMAIQSRLI